MTDTTDAKHTVLVADDDEGTRFVLARVFERKGYHVLEAGDDREALEVAHANHVDAIVLDLGMVGGSSRGVSEWLEQLGPGPGLIFVTGQPAYDTALAAIRMQADDYLEKPFEHIEDVVAAVRRAIERRRLQHERVELAELDSMTDAAEDLRHRFLSAVAHELRTPLTVIKAFASVLVRGGYGPLGPEQQQVVTQMQLETDRLAHEVDKLLSLARLESEDFSPDLNLVTTRELLRPLEDGLKKMALERGVHLEMRLRPEHAEFIGDARDLRQVIRALAENAVKFSGEGTRVIVSAELDDDDDVVEFAVTDDGIGIDPTDQQRVFEMFVQLENPLTRHAGGVGIGLTFASRIVEAHGSKLEVKSRPGKGSRFSFRLRAGMETDTQSMSVTVELEEIRRQLAERARRSRESGS
jgi:signal transduction histidine kinase